MKSSFDVFSGGKTQNGIESEESSSEYGDELLEDESGGNDHFPESSIAIRGEGDRMELASQFDA